MSKKYAAVFVVLCALIFMSKQLSFATTTPPARPDTFTSSLPVYDLKKDESKVTLNWSASVGADFYILGIDTQSNWAGQSISEQKTLTVLTYTDIRQNTVSSPITGTIFTYKLYAATYVRDSNGNPTADFVKSSTYDTATVLTDPSTIAKALSTSQIQLSWDDVQFNGQSIGYSIDKFKNGVNVGQEQILVSQIGTSVQRVGGKLVYTISNLDKSTEYFFHLLPGLDAVLIKFNPYVAINGATNIDALLQQYNESIVKLMWDEYQGSISATDLYYKVVEVTTDSSGNKTYRTIATPEVPYYYIEVIPGQLHSYIVEVRVKADDTKVAQSAEVSMQDMVVPVSPVTPNLSFTVANNSITATWDIYKTINQARDTNVKFDVWLLTDPKTIDSVRMFYMTNNGGVVDYRIGKDLDAGSGNANSNFFLVKVLGVDKYKFLINSLTPNSTYYIGVVAKKTYLMQDPNNQSQIISQIYTSDPSMATIKTSSGNLEQPVAVVKPPGLSVAIDTSGRVLVTKDTVNIIWPLGQTVNGVYTPLYQNDVYFKVGLQAYDQTFDKSKTNDPSNVDYNMKSTGVTISLGVQNATAAITGLNGNTAYVFWLKAYRDILGQQPITRVSEASDPIIVVTLPDYTVQNAKPPVPSITVLDNQYSDKITIQFNSMANIKYTIAWGTEDDISKKKGSKDYTPLSSVIPDSVVIDSLSPENVYYFWIMATNGLISSEWSDSVVGATIPIPPPDPVQGFGVKNILQNGALVPDIGEHYVSLQWDKLDKINYIIEVSKSSDFSDSDKKDVGNISEYQITTFHGVQLESNIRVWIRIFAKDATTSKVSQNSTYLTVKTKLNYDEYDSSKDKETLNSTNIPKGSIDGTKGTWNIDFTGPVAEVLMEKIRNQFNPDYTIDLSQTSVVGINKREAIIPYKVIDALSSTNQNLIIKSNNSEFIFLPGAISSNTISKLKPNSGEDAVIKIDVQTQTPSLSDNDSTHQAVSDISIINVTSVSTLNTKQIVNFDKPIKIKLGYADNNSDDMVAPYHMAQGKASWEKVNGDKIYTDYTPYINVFSDETGKYLIRKQLPDSGQLGFYIFKNEIDKIISTNLIKSVNSNDIRPTKLITLGDAVKMLLDSTDTSYNDDYMNIAKKAGILSGIVNTDSSRRITTEEGVSMVMRLYEIRTGQTLPTALISSAYMDSQDVGSAYSSYIGNALNMKILTRLRSYISPKDNVSRGEMLAMIERLLQTLGKL